MILKRIAEEGFLAESGVEESIISKKINIDGLISYAKKCGSFIISRNLVDDFASSQGQSKPPQATEPLTNETNPEPPLQSSPAEAHNAGTTLEPPKPLPSGEERAKVQRPIFRAIASEYKPSIEHLAKHDVHGKSTCKGTVADFVSLFNDRYRKLSSIHRSLPSQFPVTNYAGVKKGGKCRFIGMVRSKRTTKNGHMIIDIEDESGVMMGIISKGRKELLEIGAGIICDEVLAFEGSYRDPFFGIESISWPEVPLNKEKKLIGEDLSIAFLSDVHVGSNLFVRDNFERMLSWLNGNCERESERDMASKVKYLFVAGDLVDGIGIYPGQEKELDILDIYDQYDAFFALMERVPEYIEVVFIPGNHDAVRRGDPQPPIPSEFMRGKHSNFHFGSSPSWFRVEGLTTLLYHGNSIDSMIANVSGLSYNNPENVMAEYLRRRHLSPLYGASHVIPESNDYMVVEDIPDIVHMGHVHKNGYREHRNVTLINSGTWQAMTEYQRLQGHVPTPCNLPIYNMKSGKVSVVDFNGQGVD